MTSSYDNYSYGWAFAFCQYRQFIKQIGWNLLIYVWPNRVRHLYPFKNCDYPLFLKVLKYIYGFIFMA